MEDKKKQKPFAVKLEGYGAEGDPMVTLNGKPAYLKRTRTLRPVAGEEWYVTVKYQDDSVVILRPVGKVLPPTQSEG